MIVLPELTYYLGKAITDVQYGHLGFVFVFNPEAEANIDHDDNIFKLLFEEEYEYNSYVYTFKEKKLEEIKGSDFKRRLQIFGDAKVYFFSNDIDAENILELNIDELHMLNQLMNHKKQEPVDLNIRYQDLSKLGRLIYLNILYESDEMNLTEYTSLLTDVSKMIEPNIHKNLLCDSLIIAYTGKIIHEYGGSA